MFIHAQQSKMVKPFSTGLTKMSGAADQKLQGLQLKKSYRQKRERLKRINLDRKLLMAVTPWVGNVLLPCTLQTGKMAFHQTKGSGNPSGTALSYSLTLFLISSK